MNLKNKHIYITGCNRGMGFEFAKKAAALGNHLHLVNRSSLNNQQILELKKLGALSVAQLQLDLLSPQSIDEFLKALRGLQVDVFINNAGLLTGGLIESQDYGEIHRMLQVNLNAVVQISQGLIPQMIQQKSGCIVNNASVSGKIFFPCASTYAASKAGVVAFTTSINQELKGTGVKTLLLITPGVKTEMYEDISKLYGENLDLSFLTSIPSADWAEQVFQSLESGRDICYPRGASRLGVWLGHHFPKVFEKILMNKFKR